MLNHNRNNGYYSVILRSIAFWIISNATVLCPPSGTIMSAVRRYGSMNCSCIGFTVVRYCVITDSRLLPRSWTSRVIRRSMRTSASVSTNIFTSSRLRRARLFKKKNSLNYYYRFAFDARIFVTPALMLREVIYRTKYAFAFLQVF